MDISTTLQQYATDIEGKVVSAPVAAVINTAASTAKTATVNKTISLAELLSVLVLVANAVLTLTPKNK